MPYNATQNNALPTNRLKVAAQLKILMFCLLSAMILSVIDRTDVNWDLQNYHLYGPFSALTGRLGQDFFPAGFQGYLNPTIDLPYYIVKMIWFPNRPILVAALAGLPFGFMVFCVFNVARILLPSHGYVVWCGTTLLGITGATCLSEVGTTYDDILIADFILSALWLLLASRAPSYTAVAGICAGCAVGLKFTAAVFMPGLVVMAILLMPKIKHVISLLAWMTVGFMAVWGWWGVLLWQHFGNPLYPMLGHLFPATAVGGFVIHDTRYYPKTLIAWFFYPFFWLQGNSFVVSEEPLRDPRFALVYLALVFAGLSRLTRGKLPPVSPTLAGFYVFFGLGYVLWLAEFSILRYLVPLEALSGVAIFSLISSGLSQRLKIGVLAFLIVGALIFTKPIGWGRIGYDKTLVNQPLPEIPPHSVVFTDSRPLGYLLPYLHPGQSEFDAIDLIKPGSSEFLHVTKLIQSGANVELLTNQNNDQGTAAIENNKLAAFGEIYDEKNCVAIISRVQPGIRLCHVSALR